MNYKQRFTRVNTFIFDIDGVLTNGQVTLGADHQHTRSLNVKDAYAMHVACQSGFKLFVISGGSSEPVRVYLESIGVVVNMSVHDKWSCYKMLEQTHALDLNNVLYMGDDGPDLQLLRQVGCAVCPQDAAIDVKQVVHYVSPCTGGNACVRDVIEQVCKSQNRWNTIPW